MLYSILYIKVDGRISLEKKRREMRNSLTHAFSSTRVIASLTLCVFICVCVREIKRVRMRGVRECFCACFCRDREWRARAREKQSNGDRVGGWVRERKREGGGSRGAGGRGEERAIRRKSACH